MNLDPEQIWEYLHRLKPGDIVTGSVVAASVGSPWWLPSLKETSETAGLLLPIAGLLFIVLKAFLAIKYRRVHHDE